MNWLTKPLLRLLEVLGLRAVDKLTDHLNAPAKVDLPPPISDDEWNSPTPKSNPRARRPPTDGGRH